MKETNNDTKALDEERLQPVDKGAVKIPNEIWRKIDSPPIDIGTPQTITEWAQYADRLRCALAEALFARHQSETGAALPSDGREAALIAAVVEEAEQACRYLGKHNQQGEASDYSNGFQDACELLGTGTTIADHVERHRDRILAALAQPVEAGKDEA